ncbi:MULTISPECIES: hypothetical protein [unclassified Novosphingobium]|nr:MULTISPECIES: hypothetical protein [unclassified Novosphingobium]HQV04293.1 hypothetical protein [Novosphingobium sp.]
MVDILALTLSHGLLLFAVWKLLQRDDLDLEVPDAGEQPRD